MPADGKKGITVKVDAELHAQVKQYLEDHDMTMAEFVTMALTNELHPKFNVKEEKNMGNMRTLAFQVPEDLFQRIKDYLQRNNMTQKEFVIGLIETELEREQTVHEGMGDTQEELGEQEEESEEQEESSREEDFEAGLEENEAESYEGESEDYSDNEDEEESEGHSDDKEEESEDYFDDESESGDYTEDENETDTEEEDVSKDESETEGMEFFMGM